MMVIEKTALKPDNEANNFNKAIPCWTTVWKIKLMCFKHSKFSSLRLLLFSEHLLFSGCLHGIPVKSHEPSLLQKKYIKKRKKPMLSVKRIGVR